MDRDAFLDRLIGFEIVRRHLFPRAAVDDEGIGAEPPGRARGVHGRIAAAVDRDAASDPRRVAGLGLSEKLQRVVDPTGISCGNVLTLAQVCTNGDEHRIEMSGGLLGHHVIDLVIQDDLDAHRDNPCDLGVEHFARQAVFRNAEVHHSARQRPCLMDRRLCAQGGPGARRSTGRSGQRRRRARACRRAADRAEIVQPSLERHVAEKPLDRMDADRLVDVLAIARVLARVIADAAVHGGQRVVSDDDLPGLAIPARLRLGEPCLHVLAGGTGIWLHGGRRSTYSGRIVRTGGLGSGEA